MIGHDKTKVISVQNNLTSLTNNKSMYSILKIPHFNLDNIISNENYLINSKENVFEKALLALVLLSYIQAFSDGNKRTARITSNAILIANGFCPLSFRSVNSIDYKKAMLIFYEQNNLYAFKQIFIDQFEFAVREYF